MTEEKKIEEMVIALTEAQHEFDKAWHECLHNNGKMPDRENVFYAKYLIENKGYRKASDVIEVVRCKDCKHLEIINDGKVYAKCTMTDFEFLPFGTDTREHYCGYGERSKK